MRQIVEEDFLEAQGSALVVYEDVCLEVVFKRAEVDIR